MLRNRKFDLLALLVCLSLALATRLPGLTVFLTADEARSWFGRSLIFLDSLARSDWANTAPGGEVPYLENVSLSPAPGVTTMWAGAAGIWLNYLGQGAPGPLTQFLRHLPFDPLDPAILFWVRWPGVLIAALAVGLTYMWSRPFLGRGGAFLAAGLLALDPFGLALSRVLGHDSLVSLFMWLSLLAFLRGIPLVKMGLPERKSYAFVLLFCSGALAGLACLSKYPALSLGAFVAVTMLIIYWRQAPAPLSPASLLPLLKRWLGDIMLWSLAAAVVFSLFWPAMWVDPWGMITTILSDALRASGSAHQKGSFFLGQPVPDPGWLFYPLVALLRTTPVVLLGVLLALWQMVKGLGAKKAGLPGSQEGDNPQAETGNTFQVSLILLAYILFYLLLVTIGGKKQDRYLLPIFPALAMLAAFGYGYLSRSLLRFLRGPWLPARLPWLLPTIVLLSQAVFVLPTYPYYFSFYNPWLGGGQTAARLIQVGWGEGLNEAAAYLNRLPGAASLKAVSWYSTTFEPYFKGQTIYKIEDDKISRSPKPGLAADYVIFYRNQVQRELPSAGALQFFQAAPPVYTVTLNGLDYAWVYPSVGLPHIIGQETRLPGQAELLGYNLTDEAGRPVTSAYPESVVLISMYWEWQGQAAEDKLRLSLVDDTGQTRGYGNPIETVAPLPRDQWQEGMVGRDDFALVIFPDTPPGQYHLAAWIERPATGETVGVFPLDKQAVIPIVPRQ